MKTERIAFSTDFDKESWIYKAAIDGICMKLLHSEMLDEYEDFLGDEDPKGPSIRDQGAMLLDSIAMVSIALNQISLPSHPVAFVTPWGLVCFLR